MEKKFSHPKPISVGDTVDVTIESVGGHGDGIAKVESFVVFVKGAGKGERCRIKITEVKRTFALAEKIGKAEAEMDEAIEGEPGGPSG
ncbi:MAG TPA: TRAM domain-containing protein [Candidatus Bilamarchaeum sp.]|nr:TRAM domain-containing protein [Candidatus Bilamarchaeum sp.]